jgi:hypothetical protein
VRDDEVTVPDGAVGVTLNVIVIVIDPPPGQV